jgi:nucleotide-binding universal stress UspA family protein
MMKIGRILFPTDFSEHADYAWPYALTFAQEFGAEVHLLHVVTPAPRLTEGYAIHLDAERATQALVDEATAFLDRLVQAATGKIPRLRREVVVGVDVLEIIEYARNHEIDLIVMATHGRTGLAHALVGSVAEKVVRKSPCPVLTIKPPSMKLQAQ